MASDLQQKTWFKSHGDRPMSSKPVAVALPVELDTWVRSLPNRSQWLREAIVEKYEREQKSQLASLTEKC